MRAEPARWAAAALGLFVLQGCSPGADEAAPPRGVRVVGHRGASGLAPENTLAALDRAQRAGAREVEVDARLTRDGVVVLFHDAGLGRKTQLQGLVADHDWATLQQAEIGRWFQRAHPEASGSDVGTGLASLDEALLRHGDHFLWHIELKGREQALPGAVLDAIDRAGIRERAELSSFHVPQLLAMQELASDLPLCLIVPATRDRPREGSGARRRLSPDAGVDRAVELGLAGVALAIHDITEERVRRAHEQGVEIRAFRVGDDEQLERAIALGVDAVTVSRPDRALALLERRRAAGGR